jgi:hypothetical protein
MLPVDNRCPATFDHVIGPAHHEHIAVVVQPAAVTGEVVVRVGGQVGGDVALVVLPQGEQGARRHRQPDHDRAVGAGRGFGTGFVEHPHIPAG